MGLKETIEEMELETVDNEERIDELNLQIKELRTRNSTVKGLIKTLTSVQEKMEK